MSSKIPPYDPFLPFSQCRIAEAALVNSANNMRVNMTLALESDVGEWLFWAPWACLAISHHMLLTCQGHWTTHGVVLDDLEHGRFKNPEMNFGNIEEYVLFLKFLKLIAPIVIRQSYRRAKPRKKRFVRKFQPQPELGDLEARDPVCGEGGHVLGPGDHGIINNCNFFGCSWLH